MSLQAPATGTPTAAAPATRRGGATVTFEHVTKRYDPGAKGPGAVNDLSFTVPAGRICVLVGPSGCGKTTSLKMVNRLIEPTSGRILIDGMDAATRDVTELRRGIGYVIQQVGLFPHQTIAENVAVVPRLLGWSAVRQRERADELFGLVGLDPAHYRDRYPSQLSGGERQRVGVARALAADPPVMLMDEPFGAVDPIVRERLQNEFLRLQQDLAKTILFVTHDIDEAIKMGDLVAVMQAGGVLAQFAPPEELLAQPASDFVARFVGADRGLKRLSLSRVRDLPLHPAVTAKPGDDAADARRRILADPFPYLLLVDADGGPIGWLDQRAIPTTGTLKADDARSMSPLFAPETTLKDALSMLLDNEVQAGIAVDRTGRAIGLVTSEDIAAAARPDPSGSTLMLDWGWLGSHLGAFADRTLQHVYLAAIGLLVGFVIAFLLALWAVRRRRAYPPIAGLAGILYTIPSLVLFAALIPITGITLVTAEVPLVLYTQVIFIRNIVAGFDAVPADALEAADGMGYSRNQRLRRVELPLAVPLIVAGLRIASVSTIGLVTITGTLGDRFGGLGFFIFEGYSRAFATEILAGAVLSIALALVVDAALVGVQRQLTPWTRPRPLPAGVGNA